MRFDTSIQVFLAVVSNGSIAAWVIWSKAQFIWALLIAFSQLVSAVKPYLPYQKRIRNLEPFKLELTNLLLRMEEKWYEIFEGQLTDKEIYTLTIEIKQEKTNLESRYLSTTPLPENKKYLDQAEEKANKYFKRNYFRGTTNVN
ncbi:MAG: hypothetical protein AB4060_00515 [Crocosphaera sp.]